MKYKILEDNIGYVYYGSFSNDVSDSGLSQILSRMAICKGIIIDVRDNGGGSLVNVERIASRFNEKHLSDTSLTKQDRVMMIFRLYIPNISIAIKESDIKTGSGTNQQRMLQCHQRVRQHHEICTNVTVVGDKTGGGSGLPFSSELPNGWSVRFSACPMFNAEKTTSNLVDPDVEVMMLPADSEKIDTIIERARAIIENKSKQ